MCLSEMFVMHLIFLRHVDVALVIILKVGMVELGGTGVAMMQFRREKRYFSNFGEICVVKT